MLTVYESCFCYLQLKGAYWTQQLSLTGSSKITPPQNTGQEENILIIVIKNSPTNQDHPLCLLSFTHLSLLCNILHFQIISCNFSAKHFEIDALNPGH